MCSLVTIYLTLLLSILMASSESLYPEDSSDLWHFVSRPDLKPPKFNVQVSDTKKISPGYWFVAPYGDLKPVKLSREYVPLQTGPHIYDNNGELVWSGAHLFKSRQTFDLRLTQFNNSAALSFILHSNTFSHENSYGAGVILDTSFGIQKIIEQTFEGRPTHTNMHEFNLIQGGSSALLITANSTLVELPSNTGRKGLTWVSNSGFKEIDVASEKTIFEWWALDHIDPRESYTQIPIITTPTIGNPSDLFHLNSVDKTANGDYIISCRFTSTIYRISGVDGSIIWQLGGKNSSFKLLDFDFSNQHDARWHDDIGSSTFLTFMNNGANNDIETRRFSSAVYVRLDLIKWEATCITELPRPDGLYTRLRGNTQLLPNGNYFVGWSDNSVLSEFDSDGTLLLSASFTSPRFVTYRSYKFEFTGQPTETPALKAFNYGTSQENCVTACYVSQNGATEIAQWKFHAVQQSQSDTSSQLLGAVNKTSFETVFITQGCHAYVQAEAINAAGEMVSTSNIVLAESNILRQEVTGTVQHGIQYINHEPPRLLNEGCNSIEGYFSRWIYKGMLLCVATAVAFSCGRKMGRYPEPSFWKP